MADEPVTRTGDVRPGIGAEKSAFGRTKEDLATDQPAGFGPDPLAAADDADTFSGDDGDTEGRDGALPKRPRKFNPDIPPDERLGLRPTVSGDAAPDTPVNKDLYGA